MSCGGPGDHPLSDVFTHGIDIYGQRGTALFRKIAAMMPADEFDGWWEESLGWGGCSEEHALQVCQWKYEALLREREGKGPA
ncbi:MAG: hypothetical protein SFU85_06035 [Candidatus Methylacidiphilales bacterium]|nr:hypothetical protein [Candidatus Methylacidiphilales bacterium]